MKNREIINTVYLLTLIIVIIVSVHTAITDNDNGVGKEMINSVYASTQPSDFSFAAVGDWGCTANTNATVNNILDKGPEIVLGLGDYSYKQNTTGCWFKGADHLLNKTKISLGNHDVIPFQKLRKYTDYFNLTRPYYSFNYQNVHFIVMASESSLEVGSEQYQFVTKDLSKAASNPDLDWIVVYYHKPAYSARGGHLSYLTLRDTYHPIFQKYHVDLVLQGHNHNYERSYPIEYNEQNSSQPIIRDRNTTSYDNPRGQIFVIVGTGGQSLYPLLEKTKTPYIASEYDKYYGFLNVDITNQSRTLTAKFYGNNGKVLDLFTIAKPNSKVTQK
jgi:hypothetical protein